MFSSSIQRYKQHPVSDQVLKLRKLFSKVLKIKLRWPHIFSLVILVSSAFFYVLLMAEKNSEQYGLWGSFLLEPRPDIETIQGKKMTQTDTLPLLVQRRPLHYHYPSLEFSPCSSTRREFFLKRLVPLSLLIHCYRQHREVDASKDRQNIPA